LNETNTWTYETAEQIAADLHALGVREGGVLMVHSSLSSMGHVPGGPETVIRGLLAALGPQGTLLLPALSYAYVRRKAPLFDVRRTPSNVGAIPEYFRRRHGTRRSLHPTHSVSAVGPMTAELLDDHIRDTTPCGPHSPFHKLREVDGQILMLGCGLRPNTSMHAIEELIVPSYLFGPPITYTLVDFDGRTFEKTYTSHGFRRWWQRYDRVAQVMSPTDLVAGPVLEATAHLIHAPGLWDAVLRKMREDPLAFVAREPPSA
jgi:aminoglycoside 3-N-acetyltransferase